LQKETVEFSQVATNTTVLLQRSCRLCPKKEQGQTPVQLEAIQLSHELQGTRQAKPNIVVAVRRRVVVAISYAAVLRVVT
jgi:hypothetical protein